MTTDLSKYDASQLPSADVLGRQRYAIVVADWNSEITYAMAQGAIDTFLKHGVEEDNSDVIHVPGAVELTFGAARSTKEERVDAVIVIGCVSPIDIVWNIADTFNGLMAIPNFVGLFALSGVVAKLTKEHFSDPAAMLEDEMYT